jgi:prephenate dehydrogenase
VKLAVVGVGLIGGSVGLAARARLGAVVSGWDPAPGALDAALEVGAVDYAATGVEDALDGAEAACVAAPVGVLPATVRAVLDAAGEDCVVTDVGSTKRTVVEAVDDERFIGGHPLAGAANAGVRHARAELFDGATWYLTPKATTRGTLYERLHRLLSGLGARPAALDADTHDRMLATVSHLPHVLANVLVAQAARAARWRARAGGGRPSRRPRALAARRTSRCPQPARASATSRAWPAPTPRSGATSTSRTPTR